MRIIIKALLFICGGLLLLEFLLNILADQYTKRNTFDTFVRNIPQRVAAVQNREVIFFVGDSTIFGFGVKEPERYSLPAQLEVLIKQKNPQITCINLGRIHTGMEEHLRILSLLPKGATVIYRGGLTYVRRFDTQGEGFFFTIAGKFFESKVLKMLFLAYPHIFTRNTDKKAKITQDFQSIMKRLQLNIITIDYTTYPEDAADPFFYLEKNTLPNIPLRTEFITKGLMKEDGTFQDRFVSISGTHPNELGHYLEAVSVYNYLCQNSLYQLQSHDQITDDGTMLIERLNAEYQSIKEQLRRLNSSHLSAQQRFQVRELIYKLWFYAGLCLNIDENQTILDEYEQAKNLGLFVFHDSRIAWMMIAGDKAPEATKRRVFGQWFPDAAGSREIYKSSLWATTSPDSSQRQQLEHMPGQSDCKERKTISYVGDIYPFPLELCLNFIQESQIEVQKLSTKKAWEYFFTIPYSYFQNQQIPSCQP